MRTTNLPLCSLTTGWLKESRIALLFLRAPVVHGQKQALPRLLFRKKNDKCVFSNCKPGRIDNDELKDNDFEDSRQSETAIWPSKPSRKVWRITECTTANLRFLTTASGSDRLQKPEILIYGTTIDSVEIPTANQAFSAMASSTKMRPSDCDNDGQLKWQEWPSKRLCCHFRLSVVVAVAWAHFLRARSG